MKRSGTDLDRAAMRLALQRLRAAGWRTSDFSALFGKGPRTVRKWERGADPDRAAAELADLIVSIDGGEYAVLQAIRGRDDALALGVPGSYLRRLGDRIAAYRNRAAQSKPQELQDPARRAPPAPPAAS